MAKIKPTDDKKQLRKEYIKEIKISEFENKSRILIDKLYLLNKSHPEKRINNILKIIADPNILATAFHKLKSNTGSMTKGFDTSTADSQSFSNFKNISQKILKGTFKWSPVRRVYVPKPGKSTKRPLGIPNFNERIVQEAIRIVLNAIYEPIFQKIELNFGFRPQRSTVNAMDKIYLERQGMTTALEGDIKGAYDNVDHHTLMEILKKKISDKKLLELISQLLNAGIMENNKSIHTITGVPQGGIVSPLLFNIYMHEFDLKVSQLMHDKLAEKNKKRADTSQKATSTHYSKIRHKISNLSQRFFSKKKTIKAGVTIYPNFQEYLEKRKQFRKLKTILRNTKSISQLLKLRLSNQRKVN